MPPLDPIEDIVWRTIGGRLVDNVPLEIDADRHQALVAYLAPTLIDELRGRVARADLPRVQQLLREMERAPAAHLVSRAVTGAAQIDLAYPGVERLYRELLIAVAEALDGGASPGGGVA